MSEKKSENETETKAPATAPANQPDSSAEGKEVHKRKPFGIRNPLKTRQGKKSLILFLEVVGFLLMVALICALHFQINLNSILIGKNTESLKRLEQRLTFMQVADEELKSRLQQQSDKISKLTVKLEQLEAEKVALPNKAIEVQSAETPVPAKAQAAPQGAATTAVEAANP